MHHIQKKGVIRISLRWLYHHSTKDPKTYKNLDCLWIQSKHNWDLIVKSIPNQFQSNPNQNDFGLKQSSPFFTDKLLQVSTEKRNRNHLSCKRDVCPCQNSKSSGLSLYPPQYSGFGIKLLSKHKKFTKDLKANFSPGVISFSLSFFFFLKGIGLGRIYSHQWNSILI